jgi:uncharacterized protein YcsI (UPF0317 family)
MELGQTPEEIRQGRFAAPTAGLALGYVQTNLVIPPQSKRWPSVLRFEGRAPRPGQIPRQAGDGDRPHPGGERIALARDAHGASRACPVVQYGRLTGSISP